jgi:hypothetical protein
MGLISRRKRFTFSITTAADNTSYFWLRDFLDPTGPDAAHSLGDIPPNGVVNSVQARLQSFGGWTFSRFRILIADPILIDPRLGITVGVYVPGTILVSTPYKLIHDSGDLTSGLTGLFYEAVLDPPQPFPKDFTLGLQWETSGGAGTSTVDIDVAFGQRL